MAWRGEKVCQLGWREDDSAAQRRATTEKLTIRRVDAYHRDEDPRIPCARRLGRQQDDIAEQSDRSAEDDVQPALVVRVGGPGEKHDEKEGGGVRWGGEELGFPGLITETGDDGREEEGEGVWWRTRGTSAGSLGGR